MGSSHLGGGVEVLFISRGRVVTGASCDLQTRFGPIMKDMGLTTSRRVKRASGSLPAEYNLGPHVFPVSHPFDCLPFGVNIIVIGFHFPCASYVVDGGTRVPEPVHTDSPHMPVSQIHGSRRQKLSLLSLGLFTRCYPLIHIPRLYKNKCQDPCIHVIVDVTALFLDIHI